RSPGEARARNAERKELRAIDDDAVGERREHLAELAGLQGAERRHREKLRLPCTEMRLARDGKGARVVEERQHVVDGFRGVVVLAPEQPGRGAGARESCELRRTPVRTFLTEGRDAFADGRNGLDVERLIAMQLVEELILH